MDTQIRKSIIAADVIHIRNDISTADKKYDDTNFDSSFFHRRCIDVSTEFPSDARNEIWFDSQWEAKSYNRQSATMTSNDGNDEATNVRVLPNIDHIYEEIKAIKEPRGSLYKCDIQDYYEEYSPTTARILIDTLFLPRHEICRKCARMKYSPVYTDRLIYMKKSLFAIEVILCQRDDVSCFKYRDPRESSDDTFFSQHGRDQEDFMLIYNYTKTNAAGIFYSHCWPQDVFDLRSLLKPSICVISRASCDLVVNTQLYHRYVNSYHMRISRAGCAPMTFYRDRGTMISCTKRISYDNDNSRDSLIYQMRQSKDDEHRRNRSSLLLLEPLLLMPESTNSERTKNTKNRVLRSERVKIIRIIIAYALSFFILASITFYVVYFT